MVAKQDLIYRQVVTLKDGTRVLLRPMTKDDRQALIDLFAQVSPEERRYFRSGINDPEVVGGWVDALDYNKVLPLVAIIGDKLVGDASLHFQTGPKRHIGELRIFLSKDYRFRGLGGRMLDALIEIARRRGLYMLEVETIADTPAIIATFQNVGFINKCVYEDYFMMADGQLHDQVHMLLRLRGKDDEF
jgi:RimJ/RimL family protein N-acetyltransferase